MRFDITLIKWNILLIPCVIFAPATIEHECVMQPAVVFAALLGIVMRSLPLPNYFVYEIIFAENLVEHDFDVVAGVPIAVVIKAAGLFEDAGELHATRAHVVNVGAGGFVAVVKGALLLGFAPKDLVVAVGVEGRVNVNEVHAGVGQLGELFQIVAAINDTGVEEGAWT